MRKYETIWVKIKTEGSCTLVANPALHKRIKKAVTKEKWRDNAYKIQWDLLNREQPELVMTHPVDDNGKVVKNKLIFTLNIPISLGDL
jgi:hypothetical protein